MNYEKIYNDLIVRGKDRMSDEYTESHHIIPRCVGGTNDVMNLVNLTPEEHYLAHQLLIKIYNNNHSLVKAAMMMTCGRVSNKVYGWLRRRHSIVMSLSQAGKGNSQHGTKWIHNTELQLSKKIPLNETLSSGWETGRIVDFDNYFKKQELKQQKIIELKVKSLQQTCKQIKKKHYNFRKTEGYIRAKALKLYEEFKVSNLSLRKFAKDKKMVPMTLSKWFNKFIPEYDIVARTSASKQI